MPYSILLSLNDLVLVPRCAFDLLRPTTALSSLTVRKWHSLPVLAQFSHFSRESQLQGKKKKNDEIVLGIPTFHIVASQASYLSPSAMCYWESVPPFRNNSPPWWRSDNIQHATLCRWYPSLVFFFGDVSRGSSMMCPIEDGSQPS